jgi:hypothetical protein
MNSHLSDQDLLNRLYGVEERGAHLEGCKECAKRWDDLSAGRARFLSTTLSKASPPSDLSDRLLEERFLTAQRNRIYARLESGPERRMLWAPAGVAAAALLAVGLFVYRPVASTPAEPADAQLFADVYTVEQSLEPVAAEPIHALFEEGR